MKKDNPVNVKKSTKALLLSFNVEDSDTLPDNSAGMAFLWQQSHFSRSYTKPACRITFQRETCIKWQLILKYCWTLEIPGLETMPEKGENTKAAKSSIFPDESDQDSWAEITLTERSSKFVYILKPAVPKAVRKRSEYMEFYAEYKL